MISRTPEAVDGYQVERVGGNENVVFNPDVSATTVISDLDLLVLTSCDGSRSLEEIAAILSISTEQLASVLAVLDQQSLLVDALVPKPRPDLLVSDLPDEALIYDANSQRAFCLNKTAKIVFSHCQEERTFEEVEAAVREQICADDARALVAGSLDELEKHNLIERRPRSANSRRDFLAKVGVLAASLPLVSAVTAPSPAMAVSGCDPSGICAPADCGKVCDPACAGPPRCQRCNITMSSTTLVFTANLNNTCCDPTAFPFPTFINNCNNVCGNPAGSYCCCLNPIYGSQTTGGPCGFCGVPQNKMCVSNSCTAGFTCT